MLITIRVNRTKGSQYHKSQFAQIMVFGLFCQRTLVHRTCTQETKKIASVYSRKRLESASERHIGKKFFLVQKIYSGGF